MTTVVVNVLKDIVELTDHYSRWHRIPFKPEGYEGAGHQNDTRDEDCCEVEGTISRKNQIHLQAAVVTYCALHSHYDSIIALTRTASN